MENIEMKMAKIAASCWGEAEPQNLEEAKKITDKSELSAAKGIVKVLGLNPKSEEKIIEDIYTKESLSDDIVSQIKEKGITSKDIVKILSVIHDEWVKNKSDNFMKEGRNKEYQFVPLMLLNWKDVQSDLVFLKPILEGAGIEVEDKEIEQQFEVMQKNFLIRKNIFSHEQLVRKIQRGSDFYTELKGLETKNGGSIDELLKKPEIVERMTKQIEDRVSIKSREETAIDLIKSGNEKLDEIFWLETVRDDPRTMIGARFPTINKPISRRELMLSQVMGKPYPEYILRRMYNLNYDSYYNEVREPKGSECQVAKEYKETIEERKKEAETIEKVKKGKVEFGYTGDMLDGPEDMKGEISITDFELLSAGLSPVKMMWEEEKTKTRKRGIFSSRDIAEMDKECGLTTSEVGFFGKLINKIKEKFKGKDEK